MTRNDEEKQTKIDEITIKYNNPLNIQIKTAWKYIMQHKNVQ